MPTAKIYFVGEVSETVFEQLTSDMEQGHPDDPREYYTYVDEPSTTAPEEICDIAGKNGVAFLWLCPVHDGGIDELVHLHLQDADGNHCTTTATDTRP